MTDVLDTASDHGPADLVHIVLFRFAASTTAEQRADVQRRFQALAEAERDGRRYIRSIRSGPQISPEGAGHGFDAGFVVEFASEGDRNFYLGRPFVGDAAYDGPHDAFKAFVGSLVEDVLVFDLAAGSAVG